MDKTASLTALLSSFARSYHAEHNLQPVFADTVARRLLTDEEYKALRGYVAGGAAFFAPGRVFADEQEALTFAVDTQLAPTPLGRARYCEESLQTAVRTGTTQLVLLGAGLDTFAWQNPSLLKKLTVFEVDILATQADKRERLRRAGLQIPVNLRFVPMDFNKDDLHEQLLQSGFDEGQKTFFSWLGVSYYLPAESIEKLLASIESFAAEGSALVFDYADEGVFAATEQRVTNMLAMAQAAGEPMLFCSDETALTHLLEQHHFLLYEHLTPADIGQRYFADRKDDMSAFEHICYATAVLKGTPFINTREKILLTGLRLFAQNGFEAVSMQDIAGTMGLTKAALYKHYKSKRDIFDRIVLRMEQLDAERAARYNVPLLPAGDDPDAYRRTELASLARYTLAQFHYFTQDPFASRFRRLLTLEQYRDAEMAKLYEQYIGGGPLAYTKDIFSELLCEPKKAEQTAIDFYAPIFMFYSLYDTSTRKLRVTKLAEAHLQRFTEQFLKENSHE